MVCSHTFGGVGFAAPVSLCCWLCWPLCWPPGDHMLSLLTASRCCGTAAHGWMQAQGHFCHVNTCCLGIMDSVTFCALGLDLVFLMGLWF
jgi:hypothetical protein